jgi:hypothetical protein
MPPRAGDTSASSAGPPKKLNKIAQGSHDTVPQLTRDQYPANLSPFQGGNGDLNLEKLASARTTQFGKGQNKVMVIWLRRYHLRNKTSAFRKQFKGLMTALGYNKEGIGAKLRTLLDYKV